MTHKSLISLQDIHLSPSHCHYLMDQVYWHCGVTVRFFIKMVVGSAAKLSWENVCIWYSHMGPRHLCPAPKHLCSDPRHLCPDPRHLCPVRVIYVRVRDTYYVRVRVRDTVSRTVSTSMRLAGSSHINFKPRLSYLSVLTNRLQYASMIPFLFSLVSCHLS